MYFWSCLITYPTYKLFVAIQGRRNVFEYGRGKIFLKSTSLLPLLIVYNVKHAINSFCIMHEYLDRNRNEIDSFNSEIKMKKIRSQLKMKSAMKNCTLYFVFKHDLSSLKNTLVASHFYVWIILHYFFTLGAIHKGRLL